MSKINILCLHGFTRNGNQIEKCLKKVLNINKDVILHGVDGFVELPIEKDKEIQNQRAYWIYNKNEPLNVPPWGVESLTQPKFNFDDSLEKLNKIAIPVGNIDGIIGFSQGGMFLDKLCLLQSENKLPFKFKFAIFIATCSFDSTLYKVEIPSLHVYGENDTIVNCASSKYLITKYTNALIYKHNGRHILPSDSKFKIIFSEFILTHGK